MHEHNECDHKPNSQYHNGEQILRYCPHCAVIYCIRCKKEWSTRPCSLNHYPYLWPTATPYLQPYRVTYGDNTGVYSVGVTASGAPSVNDATEPVTACNHLEA